MQSGLISLSMGVVVMQKGIFCLIPDLEVSEYGVYTSYTRNTHIPERQVLLSFMRHAED